MKSQTHINSNPHLSPPNCFLINTYSYLLNKIIFIIIKLQSTYVGKKEEEEEERNSQAAKLASTDRRLGNYHGEADQFRSSSVPLAQLVGEP